MIGWLDHNFGIKFLDPDVLELLNLVRWAAVLWLASLFIRYMNRLKPSAGSRRSILGPMKLWLCLLISACIVIVAAARPYTDKGLVQIKRGNAEIVFIVDNSASMWVEDIKPSRIEIAVREIVGLYNAGIISKGDKVALIVFGRSSRKKLFLSTDLQRFVNEVYRIRRPPTLTGDMFPWASDIPLVLEDAYEMLDAQDRVTSDNTNWQPTSSANRLIVFLGDGDYELDDNRERLGRALKEFVKRGLKIYAVGIGTRQGVPLTSVLRHYTFKKDYDENLSRELSGLTTVLKPSTFGEFADSVMTIETQGQSSEDFLHSSINVHRKGPVQVVSEPIRHELWREFLIAALILFCLSLFLI